MNATTQTPRRLYKAETDQVLKLLTAQLEKLEKELKNKMTTGTQKDTSAAMKKTSTRIESNNQQLIQIGPNCTKLTRKMYKRVKLDSYRTVTRDLCYAIFGREVLAKHSVTGRRGPGTVSQNKQEKGQLTPAVVEDIVQHVQSLFDVQASEVLQVIRQTCLNSAIALKKQQQKK